MLHAAERMTIPQMQPAWDSKLAAIEKGGDQGVLWLEHDRAAAIRQAVEMSKDAYVAFTFVPEVRPDRRTTAVGAAIAAGAPYIMWVQVVPASDYDLREHLQPMFGRSEISRQRFETPVRQTHTCPALSESSGIVSTNCRRTLSGWARSLILNGWQLEDLHGSR